MPEVKTLLMFFVLIRMALFLHHHENIFGRHFPDKALFQQKNADTFLITPQNPMQWVRLSHVNVYLEACSVCEETFTKMTVRLHEAHD